MKISIFALVIALAVVNAVSCATSGKNTNTEGSLASSKLRKIYRAVVAYETEHGKFPQQLSDLVSEGNLTTEELVFEHLDGTRGKPKYYPKADLGGDALLELDSVKNAGKITILVDGSIRPDSQKIKK
jgi:competence protein ComGC